MNQANKKKNDLIQSGIKSMIGFKKEQGLGNFEKKKLLEEN